MTDTLPDHDLIVAGMSGGKDSTALALWLRFESGIPPERLRFEFADTGNEDALTYAFLAYLRTVIGEIHTVQPDLDFWELARHKRRFPSRKARFCTSTLKIEPSHRSLAAHMDAGQRILKATGVRHAEGHSHNDRGDVPAVAWDSFDLPIPGPVPADQKARDKHAYIYPVWYPIRAWAIADVWAIHQRYLGTAAVAAIIGADPTMARTTKDELIAIVERTGIPRNPLYDMGAQRVGCYPCINSNKADLRALAHWRPERIEFIEQQEESFATISAWGYSSFFNRKTVPLRFRSRVLRKDGETVIDPDTGEPMRVATIRDVIDWSQTAWGARQIEMFFPDEAGGACEIGGECE